MSIEVFKGNRFDDIDDKHAEPATNPGGKLYDPNRFASMKPDNFIENIDGKSKKPDEQDVSKIYGRVNGKSPDEANIKDKYIAQINEELGQDGWPPARFNKEAETSQVASIEGAKSDDSSRTFG